MRRLIQILLVLFLIGFVLLCMYAFVEPARAWMKSTIGPPASGIFSTFTNSITQSPIWKNYIVPFPNQLILGALFIGLPIAWLWHRSFNRVRNVFVRSAAKDSGMYPTMVEPTPISTASAPEPTPVASKQTTAAPPVTKEPES